MFLQNKIFNYYIKRTRHKIHNYNPFDSCRNSRVTFLEQRGEQRCSNIYSPPNIQLILSYIPFNPHLHFPSSKSKPKKKTLLLPKCNSIVTEFPRRANFSTFPPPQPLEKDKKKYMHIYISRKQFSSQRFYLVRNLSCYLSALISPVSVVRRHFTIRHPFRRRATREIDERRGTRNLCLA